MIHITLIICAFLALVAFTFFALLLQKKQNEQKNLPLSSSQYLAIDLMILVVLSLGFMMSLVLLVISEFECEFWNTLADSGFLLAISLFIIGIFVRSIYNFIASRAKKLNFSKFDEISSIGFLISNFISVILLFSINEYKIALTFLSIIIGRFVWFDTNLNRIHKDFCSIFHSLKTIPYATILLLLFIVLAVSIHDEYLLTLVAWSNIIAFGSFVLYVEKTK